jgi:hypothetical protein
MAITFPASPTNGQTFTSGNKTWQWDGTTWLAYGASLSPTVLKVDAANSRVGINNQSPTQALDVNGVIINRLSAAYGGLALVGPPSGAGNDAVITTAALSSSRTYTFPNDSGTVITTGNLSSITSTGTLSSLTSGSYRQGTDYLSPYQGFRNKIINGGFEVWQRGTARTFMQAGQYLADRWTVRLYQQNAHQRVNVALPVAGMQTRYALRSSSSTTAEVAGGTRMWTNTELESADSIPMRGKTMTFSFWVRFSSATCSSSTAIPYGNWSAYIDFCSSTTDASMATTGADAGGGSVALVNGSLPTTWTKYTGTYTIPSNANNVGLHFGFDNLGSTASANTVWYEITQVQLEEGSVATPFEQRPSQVEFALCQRYFQTSYSRTLPVPTNTNGAGIVVGGAPSVANFAFIAHVVYPVVMRVPATVTIYSYTTSQLNRVSDAWSGTDQGATSGNPFNLGDTGFSVYNTSSVTMTSTLGFMFHYAAQAEL